MYVDPIIYGKVESNPFKSEKRLYPVDYGMTRDRSLTYKIKIPKGYTVDELPESVAIGLPNQGGTFIYNIRALGEYISISSRLKIDKTVFTTTEYPYLRQFYEEVAKKHAEQIVLRKDG